MTDIITKYKKYKNMSNAFIIGTSLVLALAINFIVFDGTNLSNSLKTSVIETKNIQKSDLYIINNSGSISIRTNKNINQVKNISLSLIYNNENIVLGDAKTIKEAKISNMSGEAGVSTLFIDFAKATDLSKNQEILLINTNKKTTNPEQINLINANFTDETGETYLFSTSGITF